MNAKVHWKEGLSFTGTADSGFEIQLGASEDVGGANDGFRPLELMAVSLAGCTAMDVISILRKKQQTVTGFTVSVEAEQAADHPKVFTHLTVLYHLIGLNIDENAVRRAIELTSTKYCPAQAMLGKVVPMDLTYKIEEEGGTVREGKFTPQ
jgi:putative redox protein